MICGVFTLELYMKGQLQQCATFENKSVIGNFNQNKNSTV